MTRGAGRFHWTGRPGRRRLARRVMASPPRRPRRLRRRRPRPHLPSLSPLRLVPQMTGGPRRTQRQRPYAAAGAWPPPPAVVVSLRGWRRHQCGAQHVASPAASRPIPRPHNPPFKRLNRKRSLRPLKPPFRQVPKTYASVTTFAPINPPSRPRKHRTCPHVPF